MGYGEEVIRRTVLADEVYERLKSRIMSHVLEPDVPMRIDVLARELKVSPTPVREALARLEADALVTKHGPKGYRTNPVINRAEFEDLWAFRLLIEPWAAGLAAARASPGDLGVLRNEVEHPAGPDQDMDFSTYRSMQEHDQRFHRLIFTIAGNQTGRDAFDRTRAHLRTFRIQVAARLGYAGLAEHRALVQAIARRDPEASRLAMIGHLEASRERLRPHVPADPEAEPWYHPTTVT